MIDPAHPFASWFLWIGGASFLVVFAGPLLFAPLWWARRFGWELPADTRLTRYFGRCLGALGSAIVLAAFLAAPTAGSHALLFELFIGVGALMTVVHAWGAVERSQPLSETIEIALYLALTVAAVWIRSTL